VCLGNTVDTDQPDLRQRTGIPESASTATLTNQDVLANEGEGEAVSLKRKVGLISAISLIVGTMIGEKHYFPKNRGKNQLVFADGEKYDVHE
jgi:hypothetical protein